jgi:hypothetical protein
MISMKKRLYHSLLMTVVILGLTGCSLYPDGTAYNAGDIEVNTELSEEGKLSAKLNDVVNIDADITIPDIGDNWSNYKATYKTIDESTRDKVLKFFQKDSGIKEEGTNEYYKYTYKFDDDSSLFFGNQCHAYVIYDTAIRKDRQYETYVQGAYDIKENAHTLFPNEELEGISKSDAVSMVTELCKELNIEISDTPDVYAIDAEHAQMIADEDESYLTNKKGEVSRSWEKSDEAYVIYFKVKLSGVELTDTNAQTSSYQVVSSGVTAIVGADGIYRFEASGIYDVVQGESVSDFCTLSDVVSILASKYYYTQGISGSRISEICLEYVPVRMVNEDGFEIKPYWVCHVYNQKDDREILRIVYIDAATKMTL